jgi:hypothetical protein
MQDILDHNFNLFNDPEFIKNEWLHLTNALSDMVQYYKFEPPYTLDIKTGQAIPIDPSVLDSSNVREQNTVEY